LSATRRMTGVGSRCRRPGSLRRRVRVDSAGPGSDSASVALPRRRRVRVGAAAGALDAAARPPGFPAGRSFAAGASPELSPEEAAPPERRRRRRGFWSPSASWVESAVAAAGVALASLGADVSSPSAAAVPAVRVAWPRPRPPRRLRRRGRVAPPSPSADPPSTGPPSGCSADAPEAGVRAGRGARAFVSADAAADFSPAVAEPVPPERGRRRRVVVFGAAPLGAPPVSASADAVAVAPRRAVDGGEASPFPASFVVSVAAPCVAVPVPGRLRPRPPRRRRLRAGAAGPLPSAPGDCDDVLPAVSDGATADSIPASLTKRSFLSGHAGFAGHARTER
jgi:hypothetical protein